MGVQRTYHGSRGKGGRRFPGRDGGRRKKKRPEWQSQATHAVADVFELKHPVTTLQFRGAFHKKPSENIYLFDQMVAKKGVRYHAEFLGRWSGFRITVPENAAGIVNALLSNLDR